jgi:hypothetical protein
LERSVIAFAFRKETLTMHTACLEKESLQLLKCGERSLRLLEIAFGEETRACYRIYIIAYK